MEKNIVLEKLSTFIKTELLQNPEYALKDDEELFSTGVIDSFAIAQIGVFIETEFDLYIPDSELTVTNMDTVTLMTNCIIERLEQQDK